jgi:hypothetical protein
MIFAGLVSLIAVINLIWPFILPALNWDANAYHLPRAYLWLQEGTTRHFPTGDFRQTDFPPNASFLFLWIMAVSQGFAGLHLPQWLAGVTTGVGGIGLVRLAGRSRPIALFVGLTCLTYPMSALQMSTSQIDQITAASTTAVVFFYFRALVRPAVRWGSDAAYGGLALGLAVGTKLTVLFLLPGLATTMLVLGAFLARKQFGRRVALSGALAVVGVLSLGSYNYILNKLDFDDFVASPRARTAVFAGAEPTQMRLESNLARYLYQSLDWPGFATGPDDVLPSIQWSVAKILSDRLGLEIDGPQAFALVKRSRGMTNEDLAGFGLVGFAVLVCSPFLVVCYIYRWVWGREADVLFLAALITIAWTWFLLFSTTNPWTPYKTRYFLIFMPLLTAGVLPSLWPESRRGTWRIALVGCVSLWTAGHVALSGGRFGEEPNQLDRRLDRITVQSQFGPFIPEIAGVLQEKFGPGAKIGVHADLNSLLFPLFRSLPQMSFRPAAVADIPRRLSGGELQAALTGALLPRGSFSSGESALPRVFLHTPDPYSFWRDHEGLYGFRVNWLPDGPVLTFDDVKRQVERINVPVDLFRLFDGGMLLMIPMETSTLASSRLTGSCNGTEVPVRILRSGLSMEAPDSCIQADNPFVRFHIVADGLRLPTLDASPWAIPLVVTRGLSDAELLREATSRVVPWRGNTLALGIAGVLGVSEEGFHHRETFSGQFLRWTRGRAEMIVPLRRGTRLRQLKVDLWGPHPPDTNLNISFNNRVLIDTIIPSGPWSGSFPLSVTPPTAKIVVRSSTFKPKNDRRTLGVAIKRIALVRE